MSIIFQNLNMLGLILNLIATILLFFLGSKAVPWDMQTYSGESKEEIEFIRNREYIAKIGFFLLFIGFFLQLLDAVLKNNSKF